MKRLDLAFALTLSGLASFVAVEAYAMRQGRSARHTVGSTGTNAVVPADVEATDKTRPSAATKEEARPVARPRRPATRTGVSRETAMRRLVESSPGTYIGEVLASHDSSIARWPDRRTDPIRVWVQPMARVEDWTPNAVTIVRDAFVDWQNTGIPLSFSFVLDSASADVRVTWIDRFTESISGKTLWSHDDRWWILEANIILAVHHRTGETLDGAATRAIALHEIGHLIGLDHTTDSTAIMTPKVRVKNLSPADIATAQLLYMLPPGKVEGR